VNIILCGLTMSGKSSVGKLLAEKLNFEFVDIDRLVEKLHGKLSCREICRQEGVQAFRVLEKTVIAALLLENSSVVSTGGGSLEDEKSALNLQSCGKVIYLKADPRLLWKRVKWCDIPAFLQQDLKSSPEEAFYELANRRESRYAAYAHHTINVDHLTVEEIAAAIIKIYGN